MTISSWLGLHRSILDGSIMEEPLSTRWLWVVLLLVADKSGFVGHTPERLARRAEITLEEVKTGMKCFESPDPKSRSTSYDGRRIEKVEGGWHILNYQMHLGGLKSSEARENWASTNGASNGHTNRTFTPSATDREVLPLKVKENKGNSLGNKVGTPHLTPHPLLPTLSDAEKRELEDLSTDLKRGAFWLFRGWAEHAMKNGESDFEIAQRGSARQLRCDKRYVSDIIKEFLSRDILVQTGYSRQGEKYARYRWAIDSTLPIPAHAGMDINPDDPF
jgi:hypothetical protein